MNDDFDPELSDGLRRLAESAPRPRGDRLPLVIAGVRRRQRRVAGASALSVAALIGVTALGIHSWNGAAHHPILPGDESSSPVATRSAPGPSATEGSPAPTFSDAPSGSVSPTPPPSSNAAQPSTRPPATHTTHPTTPAGVADPKLSVSVSPATVVSGQQVRVTVTISNVGTASFRPSSFSIGTKIPSDSFDTVPSGCTNEPQFGGAECPVSELRPGATSSFAFTLTEGAPPSFEDVVFATLTYADSNNREQSAQGSQPVLVTGTAAPPASGSAAPTSARPTVESSPPAAASAASTQPSASTSA